MSKGQVLLVGGDPDVNRTLRVYLDAYRFSVQMVSRGDEALAAYRQSPPDAVILTLRLPDMDGCHLCREMHAGGQTGHSFMLALLSVDDRAAKLAALEAGADDVMVHPIDIEEVRLKLEGAVGARYSR
jgi:two-component system OmpR family response regulator